MNPTYITLTPENLPSQHLCCAIADKKHQAGVIAKKAWLSGQIPKGHVFRKLDANGKIFIEYTPLEHAWVPIDGENFLYIHCLWVSGSYKGKGHARDLLDACIADAKHQQKAGICVLSAKKKKPFLSDKKFFEHMGFVVADRIGDDYELLALPLDASALLPRFRENARKMAVDSQELTIFYSPQCPYSLNCIREVQTYCEQQGIPLALNPVDSLEKAKNMPAVFNNWAVFYKGQFVTLHLLNEGFLVKMFQSFASTEKQG